MILLRSSTAPDKQITGKKRSFLKNLAMTFEKPQIMSRLNIPTLLRQLYETVCHILKIKCEIETSDKPETATGRYAFCARSKDRKSRFNHM